MKINHPAYGPVEVSGLEEALFNAVAETLAAREIEVDAEEVAREILGLHEVPSDRFLDAYDLEVGDLCERFEEKRGGASSAELSAPPTLSKPTTEAEGRSPESQANDSRRSDHAT